MDRIRLGVIGANLHQGWAPRAHLPAVVASPDFELAAVCTTRRESARETAAEYGVDGAYDDYRAMLADGNVDAVAVTVRVPSHLEPTLAALRAGKHVFCEWPLGRTLAEAREMAALAQSVGVTTMVGLQARANPGVVHMKDLVASGYVGEVVSCRVSVSRPGVLSRPSSRTWQRDDRLGASTLTIPFGHTVDAMRYVVGDFDEVASVVSTQTRQWLETDTSSLVDVEAPDHVLVAGRLAGGAVASVHVATVPWIGSDFRMEVFGRDGTLVASAADSPQLGPVKLHGARGPGAELTEIEIPAALGLAPERGVASEAYNVALMYRRFADAIRTGSPCDPSFDTAVDLHRLLDGVRNASDTHRAQPAG